MKRRSALTVAAGIILPGIVGSESGNWLMRFTPTAAFAIQATLPRSSLVTSASTPPNGYFPISPWAGLAVLAACTAAALGAALWLLRRRDPLTPRRLPRPAERMTPSAQRIKVVRSLFGCPYMPA
jgi:uncharacterized membrane protein